MCTCACACASRWVSRLVEAARPRVATMQQQQLRVFAVALGQMLRGSPNPDADDCLAFTREFLLEPSL